MFWYQISYFQNRQFKRCVFAIFDPTNSKELLQVPSAMVDFCQDGGFQTFPLRP